MYVVLHEEPFEFKTFLRQLSEMFGLVFSLWETTQTLYWAAFGLVDLDNFELTGIKEFTR
jgi:hypothetical protein